MTNPLAQRVSEISTRIAALCLSGALAGCAGGYGTATSRTPITDAVTGLLGGGSAPAITTLPGAPVQTRPGTYGGYPSVPVPTGTPSELNPNLSLVFDNIAAQKGKKINFQGVCGQYFANAANGIKGPDPLTNSANVGSLPNQGRGVVQGLLNQATGNRGSLGNRIAHTLGSSGIQTSAASAKQWSTACNSAADLNVRAWRADQTLDPNSQAYASQWNSIASQANRPVQLAIGTEEGAAAMSGHAVNGVITDVGRTGTQKLYPTQRGIVPDAIQRILN